MAQLVEQLIRNQQVAGSSPASSSKNKRVHFGLSYFCTTGANSTERPAGSFFGVPENLVIFGANKRSPVRVRPVAPKISESISGSLILPIG